MTLRLFCAFVLTLLTFSCGTERVAREPARAEIASRPSQERGFHSEPAGLADDYPGDSFNDAKLDRDFETLKATGAKYYRIGISWAEIETSPGKYDWSRWDKIVARASENGITLIPYVCYSPHWTNGDAKNFWREPPSHLSSFGEFMAKIAARYRGKIYSWELWNEPDNPDYWLGTADQFAEMIWEAAPKVRAADPGAKLVLGGMAWGRTRFLDQVLLQDHLGNAVDVINFHGYLETWSPERAERYPDRIQRMHDLVLQAAPSKELWMAEFGYSDVRRGGEGTVYAYEHTPQAQAAELWRDHVMALASGELSLTAWYRIDDLPSREKVIGDANNRHLGLLDVSGHRKPAFYAFRLFNQLLGGAVRPLDLELKSATPADDQTVVRSFEREDGSAIVTAWLRSSVASEVSDSSGMASDSRRERIRVSLPAGYREGSWTVRYYDLKGNTIGSARLRDGRLPEIELRGPQVVIAEISRGSP